MDKHKAAAFLLSLGSMALPVVTKYYGGNTNVAFGVSLASMVLTLVGTHFVKPTVGGGDK